VFFLLDILVFSLFSPSSFVIFDDCIHAFFFFFKAAGTTGKLRSLEAFLLQLLKVPRLSNKLAALSVRRSAVVVLAGAQKVSELDHVQKYSQSNDISGLSRLS
jgi:hypothetical protein